MGYLVLGCGLQLLLCPVLPRFLSVILAEPFKVFRSVFLVICSVVGAGFFPFGFFNFLPHAFAFLLCKFNLFGQFVFKSADMVEVHLYTMDGVFRLFYVAFMHKDFADKLDRKSTRLNSSHANISYAVFCLKKKKLP